MLSMQNTPSITHLNGSTLQDDGCPGLSSDISPLPLPEFDGSLRASTSSTSTGASPDDTSTDSLDWHANGGSTRSPPAADPDAPVNVNVDVFPPSLEFMLDPRAQIADMSDAPPKVEELEDEDIQSIKTSEVGNEREQSDNPAGAPVPVPRKRGRPRKHPLPAPGNQAKVTKGRSKTGCITCRRRKKKCDETKPA